VLKEVGLVYSGMLWSGGGLFQQRADRGIRGRGEADAGRASSGLNEISCSEDKGSKRSFDLRVLRRGFGEEVIGVGER
jgi:hypothetical protein